MKKPRKLHYQRELCKDKVRRVVISAMIKDITPDEAVDIIDRLYWDYIDSYLLELCTFILNFLESKKEKNPDMFQVRKSLYS